jgi:hypothetical protein
MEKRYFIWFLIAALTCLAGAHELRIWEDVNGNQFEGRFLRELFGKLTGLWCLRTWKRKCGHRAH